MGAVTAQLNPGTQPVCARRMPGPPLSDWVQSIWYCAETLAATSRELLLPRGHAELVIEHGEGRVSIVDTGGRRDVDPVSVRGASVRPLVIEKLGRFETVGVTLKPGGSDALLNVAADALGQAPTSLARLRGSLACELRDRGPRESAPAQKLAEIDRVLTDQVRDERSEMHRSARQAVAHLARTPQQWRIAELSADLGISRRRLEELFRMAVGVSPKRMQRLWRFRAALACIDQAPELGWAMFALEAGYYDQAHLTNEFRAHAGITPAKYLTARGRWVNHLPVGAEM